ncbi:MAG: hypothetical protein E7641_03515 [Ruminococcaceae bacterium]|nr:hypothetical protein [Oscillospiraceae bacterium]
MTYHNAIKYIQNASDDIFDKSSSERISHALSALDTPWKRLKYIRIAGSNGKTVCAAMLSSILTEAGYKVCTLTMSPLDDPREAVLYCNNPLSVPEFTELISPVYELAYNLKKQAEISKADEDSTEEKETQKASEFSPELTRGEILLCAALLLYKKTSCDLLIIESEQTPADPSLTLPPPFAAMISGAIPENDPAELSRIKTYIQRGIGEVVSTPQNSHAYKVIADTCALANCRLSLPIRSSLTIKRLSLIGTEFTYGGEDYKLSMCGRFQTTNAITVIETVKLLRRAGYKISVENEKAGLASLKLRSRFELLSASPTVIADSTYKSEAVDTVCESLFDFSEITGRSLSLCLPLDADLISNYISCLSKRGYKLKKIYSLSADPNEAHTALSGVIPENVELVTFPTAKLAVKTLIADLESTGFLLISGRHSFADTLRLEIVRKLNF